MNPSLMTDLLGLGKIYLIGLVLFGVGGVAAVVVTVLHRGQPEPMPIVRSVSWYAAHASERAAMRRTCRDNPGQADANCVNAEEAADRISIDQALGVLKGH